MAQNNKKIISAIISIFIVGGGQIYSNRILTGLWFMIVFYGTILVTKILWIKMTFGFWFLFGAWILFWLFNIYDAYKCEEYFKPAVKKIEKNCASDITN
jgi:uncharacterized membrane protein